MRKLLALLLMLMLLPCALAETLPYPESTVISVLALTDAQRRLADFLYGPILRGETHIDLPDKTLYDDVSAAMGCLMQDYPELFHLGRNYSVGYYRNKPEYATWLEPTYRMDATEAASLREQLLALEEALRVTKKGGILMAAYCGNDATMVQYCFGRGMLREEKYRNLVDPVTFKAASDPAELFELYRREEIDALMSRFKTCRLHYVGTDMATNYMRATIDEMEEELFELYLKYHFVICERSDMVGASHHILDIHRKL